eukprot:g3852.t1
MNGLGIPAESVLDIFSNAEEVLAFNEQILLDIAGPGGGVVGGRRKSIGATFRTQPDEMFKSYSVYVNKYPQALKSLAVCEQSSEFKAFVRACEHQEVCHGLDLRAYLIQPVQRVPRYRLLIIELLKHTRESHPDWANLNAALENVSRTVAKLNQGARDQERFLRALELQYEFRESFLKPSSHLVKEGDLLKVSNGPPRRYKFVLFSDMLVYGTETIRAKIQRDHHEYKVHRRIPLCECLVLDYGSSDSFVVVKPSGKSFVAMAVSPEGKQAWLEAFAESFAELHLQQNGDSRYKQNGYDRGTSSPTSETSSRRNSDDEWTHHVGGVGSDFCCSTIGSGASGRDREDDAPASPPPKLLRPRSIGFPTGAGAALAQTMSASMISATGRWSLPGGGGGGGAGGGRNSLASNATSGASSSSPSVRSLAPRQQPINRLQARVGCALNCLCWSVVVVVAVAVAVSAVAVSAVAISAVVMMVVVVIWSFWREGELRGTRNCVAGGGGGAAEAVGGRWGGGSEVVFNGGGGAAKASKSTTSSAELRAVVSSVEVVGNEQFKRSRQAAVEMLTSPFSDDDEEEQDRDEYEDEDYSDSDSDASKALDKSIERSRTSGCTVGHSGNVRKMLAKFETEKKLPVALPSRRARRNSFSLHRSTEGDQGTAEEEDDERSSVSGNPEREYVNPMLLEAAPPRTRTASIDDDASGASANTATGAGGGVRRRAGNGEDSPNIITAAAGAGPARAKACNKSSENKKKMVG